VNVRFSIILIFFACETFSADTSTTIPGYLDFTYPRFTVHVNNDYLTGAGFVQTQDLLDKFEPRFEYMENLTQWKYEDIYPGEKLQIYIEPSGGCFGGIVAQNDTGRKVTVNLHDPYIWSSCKQSWRENNVSKLNNPGELGDYWGYMKTMLHESMHGTIPAPIWDRKWLNEGIATYLEYTVLEHFGDINRETVEYKIKQGNSNYNWDGYVANDYKDPVLNQPIQSSKGYSITAQMLINLENTYDSSMFARFYELLSNNLEVLEWADSTATYYDAGWHRNNKSDAVMIHLFSMAADTDLIPTFRYDGPSGPGWGVRDIDSLDFLPDLSVKSLLFSNSNPGASENITVYVTVANAAEFGVKSHVELNINGSLIDSQTVLIPIKDSVIIQFAFSVDSSGVYDITAHVDKANLKAEMDDSNNVLTKQINVGPSVAVSRLTIPLSPFFTNGTPNPFNSAVNFQYTIQNKGQVELTVFSINGQLVKNIVKKVVAPGKYAVIWHGVNNSKKKIVPGAYIVKYRSDGYQKTSRIVYLK